MKEAERAKGPEDESSMGRVFIISWAVSDENMKMRAKEEVASKKMLRI